MEAETAESPTNCRRRQAVHGTTNPAHFIYRHSLDGIASPSRIFGPDIFVSGQFDPNLVARSQNYCRSTPEVS